MPKTTPGTPAILIPRGIDRQVETSLKSIQQRFEFLDKNQAPGGQVTAAQFKALQQAVIVLQNQVAGILQTIAILEAEIAALQAAGSGTKVPPIIETFGSAANPAPFVPVYESAPGTIDIADNTIPVTSQPFLGITVGHDPTGYQVCSYGDVVNAAWAWDPNLPVFVGAEGSLTQTPPVSPAYVQIVGFAVDETTLRVDPKVTFLQDTSLVSESVLALIDGQPKSVLVDLSGAYPPYYVPPDVNLRVALNKQAVIGVTMNVDGYVQVDGIIVESNA